ncbi:hypothetical protein HAX54_002559 [Datura stramonium]|uniref:Uncharacterized protein n=1 Tax=Datura stramonium TaxID=4076 RepID=A0ABS8T592_DATST|nr:hypothetical protein [Datura stramonium]
MDRRMAPSGCACKRWDDSARRWHGQKLDGCKASLWEFSWRGKGKEDWKIFQVLKLWALKSGILDQQGATDRRMTPRGRACKRWDDSTRRWHGQKLDECKARATKARRVQGKLVGTFMGWARQGILKNNLSVEAVGAKGWHVHQPGMCAGRGVRACDTDVSWLV